MEGFDLLNLTTRKAFDVGILLLRPMGDFIEFLYSRFLLSNGVSIDTRTIEEGNLFFAISGPNFNANEFAAQALEKGASYAVVDDEAYVSDDKILLAANALTALQELARFHRSRFKRPVFAITGSNGKTTTKELITNVLSGKYIVHSTKGNYNNHIGVPLTLLHIHPQVEIAIIEMGANHVGEIGVLSELASPTHGMITNIGHAHTEGFGGFEGVIRGKSELFDYLRKNDGKVFINMNDPVLSNMAKRFEDPHCFPDEDVKLLNAQPFVEFSIDQNKVSSNMIGAYNFDNIASAISVGRHFGVPDEKIAAAIQSYTPENARSQVIKKDSLTIILDAYNANPDSMKAALNGLAKMDGRKVAILGDMNELENSDQEHDELIAFAKELDLEVITIGKKIGTSSETNTHFDDKEPLIEYLKEKTFPDAAVLLKASRSIELETILDYLQP